jgi:hypothetical protein
MYQSINVITYINEILGNKMTQDFFTEVHLLPGKLLESLSLVLVINDTKLLMPYVKCFELGISNTCDEGVCGKEWWPQEHKEMVHGHEMMIMVEMHII